MCDAALLVELPTEDGHECGRERVASVGVVVENDRDTLVEPGEPISAVSSQVPHDLRQTQLARGQAPEHQGGEAYTHGPADVSCSVVVGATAI